jgi:chromosome segregation ATPase
MATNIVALTQPTNLSDIQADVRNALDARGRLPTLLEVLTAQRVDAVNAFLRTFAADLAAVKGDADKAFVDAQFAKFTAWKAADDELAKRIDALKAIGASLAKRIDEFESEHRDEVIDLLTRQIAALNEQLKQQTSDEDALNQRIKALESELNRVAATPTKPAAAKKAKK